MARLVVVAGEVSGDHQGALLVEHLRRLRPDLAVIAAGGPRLASAGAELLLDTTRWGVIGYAEAYVRLPVFAARFWRLVRLIDRVRPDLLLLVDFPGMNRELVRRFSGRVPLVYYFPPQTYGRRGRSAARMAACAVRLLATLPFEADSYRRAGADVVYVGHPAVDAARDVAAGGAPLRAAGEGERVVALLPGSRPGEVRSLLPPFLEAARGLLRAHRLRFVLPVASPHLHPFIERALCDSPVEVQLVPGRALEVMAGADAAVVASGTAAVEAACLGVPMVVAYRVSRLTEWIARHFVMTPGVGREGWSVPSIVLGRPIVPELLQQEVTGARIQAEVERLLFDEDVRRRIREDLALVRERLGPPGVLGRAAREVLRVLDSQVPATIR